MKTIHAIALGSLLAACAHQSDATREQRAEERSERQHARAVDPDGDGVAEIPARRRADRDRLASAGNEVPAHDPDNTGINARDRDTDALTPLDQGNSEIDLDLTQRVRKAVMADDSLSFGAKNVKIISRDGHVTLRGPVKSAEEKLSIEKAALSAAGAGHVTNQLEVAP